MDNQHLFIDEWSLENNNKSEPDSEYEWTVKSSDTSLTKGATDNVKKSPVPEEVTKGRHVRILHVQPAYKLLAENSCLVE